MKPQFRRWTAVVLLIAMIAALPAAAVWAVVDRTPATGTSDPVVTAAVVLDDEPVQVGRDSDTATVAAGRVLAAELQEAEAVEWQVAQPDGAEDGLTEGTYDAVVRVPPSFTADVASTTTANPHPADVEIRWGDDVSTASLRAVTESVQTASADVSALLTEQHLEGVYAGLDRVDRQLGEAATGASDITKGSEELAAGADEAAEGSNGLNSGLTELDSAAADLAEGTAGVAEGVSSLSSAGGDLEEGASTLAAAARSTAVASDQLADGLAHSHESSTELANGTSDAARGIGRLDDSADALATSAADLRDGQDALADSASDVAEAMGSAVQGCPDSGATPQYCSQLQQVAAGIGEVGTASDRLATAGSSLADGADGLSGSAGDLGAGADQASTGAAELRDGLAGAADGSRVLAERTDDLAEGAAATADGAARAASGASELAAGTTTLGVGASEVSDGTSSAGAGSGSLDEGIEELEAGSNELAAGSGELTAGLESGATTAEPYPEETRTRIADAGARPITVDQSADAGRAELASSLTGAYGPLLAGSFAVLLSLLAAVRRRSRIRESFLTAQSSSRLSRRLLLPAAVLGAIQGGCVLAASWALGVEIGPAAVLASLLAGVSVGLVAQASVAWSPTGAWAGAFVLMAAALLTVTTVLPHGAFTPLSVGVAAMWPGAWLAGAVEPAGAALPAAVVLGAGLIAVLAGGRWVAVGRRLRT